MLDLSFRLLHLRTLNHLSRDHQFTYIGARILAESLHPDLLETWTKEYLSHKALTSRRQVYWKYSLYKGLNHKGSPDYRKCVIGSPTTHLTETWVLALLSQQPAFQKHPCVYSYAWPSNKSSHLFQYYLKGYRKRERDIAAAAAELNNSKILVLDIKRFYPTIDVALARSRFKETLDKTSLESSERDSALQCVEELTSIKNEDGLPTGPPLSHVLANVFLQHLDFKLSSRYKHNYFRYVDDIAIVVPKNEVDAAQQFFESVAEEEGLEVNLDKTDIQSGEEWTQRVNSQPGKNTDSFSQLVHDIRTYLAHNPDDFDQLRNLFRSNDFVLPFSRLRSVASYSPFRRLVRNFWSRHGSWFGHSTLQPARLLERALQLRREFKNRVSRLHDKPFPDNGMARRWAIQDFRFVINRYLYLISSDEQNSLLRLIPECPELQPTRVVLQALTSGDISEVVRYPGPTVSAFCQLWTESTEELPKISWSSHPSRAERDGASVLALHGLCHPPSEWISRLDLESSQIMVKLSARESPKRRTFDDFSYIDEMESLFLSPRVDFSRFLSTRFDDGEDIVLPALSLGGSDYMS
jgi:hypothetical protein